jgi:Ion transport protein
MFMKMVLSYFNYVFAGIFSIEFLMKFIGFGYRYFRDGWNVFDMIIVILTLISITIDQNSNFDMGPTTTIIRSFRIARIFYMLKRNRALKSTFMTFLVTLPSMANIGSLLALFILIYSILGVYLFADVKLSDHINKHVNFKDVGTAFLTLIRVTTGEKWPEIMEALSR